MKTIKKTIFYFISALGIVSLSSCDSFLEEYSQDLAKVNSWEDLDEVLIGEAYAKTGKVYIEYSALYTEQDLDLDFLHFMTDEIVPAKNKSEDIGFYSKMFPFFTWQQDTGVDYQLRYVGGDEKAWNSLYSRINVCNMVISLIDDQPEPHPSDKIQKSRVKGEAYFLRGLYYFILTNLYCEPYIPSTAASTTGMPIKLSEVIEDIEFKRATLAESYDRILSDLKNAENLLADIERKTLYRADINTVKLLMSRVYLYMQDWENAAAKAKEVLSANDELLNLATKTPGENCIDTSSPEYIFTMGDYIVAAAFVDSRSAMPAWTISDDMINLYDRNDLRMGRYIGDTQYGRPNAFRKVNGQREAWGSYFTTGSVFTLRTPEAYLTLAEASAFLGEESTARSYLERLLATRMNNKVTITESGNDLIDLIRDERAREFLLEGHRWFDLRRYTVCEPYPWSKEIEHGYNYYSGRWGDELDHTDWYRLEKNDGAYTLPIPRSIRNFQNSLGNANRPNRSPYTTTLPSSSGDDDDDDDWDDWD